MESKTDRILSKFLESMFIGYDKTAPKIKSGAAKFFKLLLGILAAAVILIAIGILTKNNELTAIGNIGKIAVFGAVMLVIAISTIPFSERRYVRATLACAASQLVITAIIAWSPMPMTFSTYFLMNLGSAVLCLALWAESPPLKILGAVIIGVSVVTLFFPSWDARARTNVAIGNEPRPLLLNRGDVPLGKVRFFLKGKPVVWYLLDHNDKYELFDAEGKHDQSTADLKPMTENIRLMLAENEDLISPRNFRKSSRSAAPAAPTTPAANKSWKFRYEVSPGYQGYTHRVFSGWAPVRIDRWDSQVKVVTFGPDGKEAADFEGIKTGRNWYRGSWRMRNGSGQGEFTFHLKNSNLIEGTINDVTQNPRFVNIYMENS